MAQRLGPDHFHTIPKTQQPPAQFGCVRHGGSQPKTTIRQFFEQLILRKLPFGQMKGSTFVKQGFKPDWSGRLRKPESRLLVDIFFQAEPVNGRSFLVQQCC